MSDEDYITTDFCDECGTRAPGVKYHTHGEPVMFLCKHCSAVAFDHHARQDIDRWLTGGNFRAERVRAVALSVAERHAAAFEKLEE